MSEQELIRFFKGDFNIYINLKDYSIKKLPNITKERYQEIYNTWIHDEMDKLTDQNEDEKRDTMDIIEEAWALIYNTVENALE